MLIHLFFLFLSCSCFAFSMTLEEKVGQVLMVHFHGEEANEEARVLIQEVHVGGIIYYNWANGLYSPEQVAKLSAGLQKMAEDIPLLLAVDQEGGKVARLTFGFTLSPGNQALGLTGMPELAEGLAFVMGSELRGVGINMNLAPVVDVNSNPSNPVIGSRSFGDTPEVVIAFGRSALQGYKRAGVLTSIKHFPGYGDVGVDPHADLPFIAKTREELEEIELLPFRALAGEADSIMTAHIFLPALDTEWCATLSPTILALLREEMGFKGVIISDSLVMEGILKKCPCIEEAAIQAFTAGCDILILGGRQLIGVERKELTVSKIQEIHRAMVDAVKEGRIPEERLDEAVQRIKELKRPFDVKIT